MARAPKQFYLTNKELLKEIHKSKMSYCYVNDEQYAEYDLIVESFDEHYHYQHLHSRDE